MPKLSYHLRWNNHLQNLQSLFENLYTEQSLVDVTISCSDGLLYAHKLVLSACSPYFEQIFKGNPCKHPILILRGIKRHDMQILLEYMYVGSVDVVEEDLESLLSIATELQIKGLMQCPEDQTDPLYENIINEKSNHPNKEFKRVASTPPLPNNSDNLKWQAELVPQPAVSKLKENDPRTDQPSDSSYHSFSDEMDSNNLRSARSEENESGLELYPCVSNKEEAHLKKELRDECTLEEIVTDYRNQGDESVDPFAEPTELVQQAPGKKSTEKNDSDCFCNICIRSFQNKVAYQRHMLTHSGVKPHRCTYCSQSFLRLSHLQRHIRVHTGERPYSCIKCPKQFARSDKLRQHYLLQHQDTKVSKVPKPRGRPRKHFDFYGVATSNAHVQNSSSLYPNVDFYGPSSAGGPEPPHGSSSTYPPLSIIPISSNGV